MGHPLSSRYEKRTCLRGQSNRSKPLLSSGGSVIRNEVGSCKGLAEIVRTFPKGQ